jgi:hypothetical protein
LNVDTRFVGCEGRRIGWVEEGQVELVRVSVINVGD